MLIVLFFNESDFSHINADNAVRAWAVLVSVNGYFNLFDGVVRVYKSKKVEHTAV